LILFQADMCRASVLGHPQVTRYITFEEAIQSHKINIWNWNSTRSRCRRTTTRSRWIL